MDLSSKTEQIVKQGRHERGRYDPEPGSVPYRLYQDYVRRGGYVPDQENFCHFWRVVVFWAPAMWLRDHTVNTDGFKSFVLSPAGRVLRGVGRVISFPFRLLGRGITKIENHFNLDAEDIFMYILSGLLVASVLSMLVSLGVTKAWWMPFVVIAGFAAFCGVVIGISALLENASEKRRKRLRDAIDSGELTLDQYWALRVKKPGRVKRFFRGVGQLLVLLAQIIRVKKWKICPLVNIDPQA